MSPQLTAALMGQVTNTGASVDVSPVQAGLLVEVADAIIPTTDTPGAKAAGVEQFIVRVMRDCHPLAEQEAFYSGLAQLDADSRDAYDGKGFAELDQTGKHAALMEAKKAQRTFFHQMRQLTIAGYFTSEIGATKALEYLPIPGQFRGDVPFKEGQKAWAM